MENSSETEYEYETESVSSTETYEELIWPEDRELPELSLEELEEIIPIFEVTEAEDIWSYRALAYARQVQLAFRWEVRGYIDDSLDSQTEIGYPFGVAGFSMNLGARRVFTYHRGGYIYRLMRIEVTAGEHYVFVISEGDRWIIEAVDGPQDQKAMFTMIVVQDKLPYSIPIINPIRFLGKGGYTYSFRLLPEDFNEEDLWMQNFRRPEFIERLEMLNADYRYVHQIWPELENADFGIYIIPKHPEPHEMIVPVHCAEILLTRFSGQL